MIADHRAVVEECGATGGGDSATRRAGVLSESVVVQSQECISVIVYRSTANVRGDVADEGAAIEREVPEAIVNGSAHSIRGVAIREGQAGHDHSHIVHR